MQNRKKTAMVIAVVFFILAVLAAVVCLKGKDALPAVAGAEADDGKMPAYERLLNLLSGKEDGAEEGARGAAGTYAGNRYNNERFGISAVFDEGWYFFDSKTREGITENTYGMAGKDDAGASVYDLYARKDEEGKRRVGKIKTIARRESQGNRYGRTASQSDKPRNAPTSHGTTHG